MDEYTLAKEVIEAAERFDPFSMTEDSVRIATFMRAQFARLAGDIVRGTPNSRERSLALTELESSSRWFIRALARNGNREGS